MIALATSAAVAPTGLAGAALANLTTGLLDAAFSLGSGEGICQTVVAAAAAASGDVALTSTLVDAVGAVASGVDADAALVEQTSSSLLAAANNGSGLAESAATSALAYKNLRLLFIFILHQCDSPFSELCSIRKVNFLNNSK